MIQQFSIPNFGPKYPRFWKLNNDSLVGMNDAEDLHGAYFYGDRWYHFSKESGSLLAWIQSHPLMFTEITAEEAHIMVNPPLVSVNMPPGVYGYYSSSSQVAPYGPAYIENLHKILGHFSKKLDAAWFVDSAGAWVRESGSGFFQLIVSL